MDIDGWKYYNHAALPTTAPHEEVNIDPIKNGKIWKLNGKPYFARWTSNFDCGYETNWWYCIVDHNVNIDELPSKYRNVIKKGLKYFSYRIINPKEYVEQIIRVEIEAYKSYPHKYKPLYIENKRRKEIMDWTFYRVVGVFDIENELCGFSVIEKNGKCLNYCLHKVNPMYERQQINAALVFGSLELVKEDFYNGCYLCDGERNISHETAFQKYLEKYFGFRKVYCKLNIVYNNKIKFLIIILYPFRKLLNKFDKYRIIHKINSILMMEEIRRGKKYE